MITYRKVHNSTYGRIDLDGTYYIEFPMDSRNIIELCIKSPSGNLVINYTNGKFKELWLHYDVIKKPPENIIKTFYMYVASQRIKGKA